jgi:hypothetical protein
VNYADHATPSPRPRSLATWLLLLTVWTLGLAVWVLYFIAALYLLTKAIT